VEAGWLSLWGPVTRSWDGWLLTLILACLVPFHGVLAYGRLKMVRGVIPTRRKLRLYGTIVAMEWGLVAATLAVSYNHGVMPRDLGQTIGNPGRSATVIVVGMLGLLALTGFNLRQIRNASREELEATLQRARKFVPVGRVQIIAFTFVAVTAGICEEILYRGWLISFTGALLGSIWAGMVAAALIFGLGHAYQGRQGIAATGALGLVFGTIFVTVKSLVPGQIIHAMIDIVNGILAGRVVKRLGPESDSDSTAGGSDGVASDPVHAADLEGGTDVSVSG
jgi:membrane protease YdiL (CAAX protease family)